MKQEIWYCIERKENYGLLCSDGRVDPYSNNPNILKFTKEIDALKYLYAYNLLDDFYVCEHT